MNLILREANTSNEINKCLEIRRDVFINEQNVPEHLEIDGLDPQCRHFIVQDNTKAIATARVRIINDTAKIERVAVLSHYRGQKIGLCLMEYILKTLQNDRSIKTVKLGSQNHAIPFYKRLGFQIFGEEYMDAGIAHHDMIRKNQA